jgi:cytochrome c-type biogenesis protein CcmH/NrfG
MTADQTPPPPEPGPDAGIDDIQADIEHTRNELG